MNAQAKEKLDRVTQAQGRKEDKRGREKEREIRAAKEKEVEARFLGEAVSNLKYYTLRKLEMGFDKAEEIPDDEKPLCYRDLMEARTFTIYTGPIALSDNQLYVLWREWVARPNHVRKREFHTEKFGMWLAGSAR